MWVVLLPLAGLAAIVGVIATRKTASAAPMALSPAAAAAAIQAAPDLQKLVDVALRMISGKASVAPALADVQQAIQIANSYKLSQTAAALSSGFKQWPSDEVWPGTQTMVTQFITSLWGVSPYRTLTA